MSDFENLRGDGPIPLEHLPSFHRINMVRLGWRVHDILNQGGWHEKVVFADGYSKNHRAYQLRRMFPTDLRLKALSKRCGVTFGRVDLTFAPTPVVRLHTNLGVFTVIYRKK